LALRRDLGEIFRELAKQKDSQLVEGHLSRATVYDTLKIFR
jgi:hypothetical protein